MDVIHFTEGATDVLPGFRERGTGFVLLIEGYGDVEVSCLHLSAGAEVCDLWMTHDRTMLVLQGRVVARVGAYGGSQVDLLSGMGVVLKSVELFEVIECPEGRFCC